MRGIPQVANDSAISAHSAHSAAFSHSANSVKPMTRVTAPLFLIALVAPGSAPAQHPLRHPVDAVEIRFARSQPILHYILRVDSARLSGFEVELRIQNAPDTFHLAMAAHPEYDDRYFRYVVRPTVLGKRLGAEMVREDSSLWRVRAPGGEALVRYRLELPPATDPRRSGWKPFLAPTGGLVGGPHSFMYLTGATLAPAHVSLELPFGWEVATGLEPTSDPRDFFAPTADALMDSPIFVGRFRTWRWAVDGVPHRLVYWPLPDAVAFDTAAMVSGIERLTREVIALFGRAPYREYTFVFQDGAVGSLEHLNSLQMGAPSTELARGLAGFFSEAAHEYTHSWNLMRIRPAEYRTVDYRTQPPVAGLWWSEGLTLYYADRFLRRAGLPVFDSTRLAHFQGLLSRYLATPGHSHLSAERVSRAAYNASPETLGDYGAGTHLQGEIIGGMLDLIVRGATDGRRSMDDVMRLMLERFSGERGFTGLDIERTVAELCGCSVTPFFAAHVRSGTPIDFDRYLGIAGLRANVTWNPALDQQGHPAPDLRIRAWQPPGDGKPPRLLLNDPASAWGRAGLHTGDDLVDVNDAPVATVADFRAILGRIRLGDTLRIAVRRPTGRFRTTVIAAAYDRPTVRIEELPQATERQRAIRAAWLTGAP